VSPQSPQESVLRDLVMSSPEQPAGMLCALVNRRDSSSESFCTNFRGTSKRIFGFFMICLLLYVHCACWTQSLSASRNSDQFPVVTMIRRSF
jgi:hypothetical protein